MRKISNILLKWDFMGPFLLFRNLNIPYKLIKPFTRTLNVGKRPCRKVGGTRKFEI